MMGFDEPIRRWVAVVLAVALPLCCCTLRFGEPGPAFDQARVEGAGSAVELPPCCRGEAPASTAQSSAPTPAAPEPAKPCSCAKDRLASGMVEQSPADHAGFSASVAFILADAWLLPQRIDLRPVRAGRAAGSVPAATLLRLHCALIV